MEIIIKKSGESVGKRGEDTAFIPGEGDVMNTNLPTQGRFIGKFLASEGTQFEHIRLAVEGHDARIYSYPLSHMARKVDLTSVDKQSVIVRFIKKEGKTKNHGFIPGSTPLMTGVDLPSKKITNDEFADLFIGKEFTASPVRFWGVKWEELAHLPYDEVIAGLIIKESFRVKF